jgi:aminopeptidase N/puromycin-sensitive aminopeptidase
MIRTIASFFSLRSKSFIALSLTTAAFCLHAGAQRLPGNAIPSHYVLTLTPDLKAATFSGAESIDVTLAKPSNTVTLNAAEIEFKSVVATIAGKDQPAQVSLDADKEQATFTFAQPLPAGEATLKIVYTGILNDKLRGFYLSKTEKRNYAVTQFEPTDARRAFPSFDEPAMKATFDVTLVVDKDDTAISNTNIIADTPAADGKHALHFATTPKMSSYLVAFLVGDFKCTSGEADGVPIRSCATPDKVELGKYALSAAEFVLHYYDTYFGIKYPMPKLDMIAIPDFEAGAMENFGAITYRETDLLIDEKTASENAKKNVAEVVAHEMAHQWFGDMVTMQWWDNIWLNEGFASWMENKPVAAWKPEWKIPEDVATGLNGTLSLDAQKTTRTIRAEANTPDQINEMFDGISYGKAGAMLLMVENYLGEETFRQGVHNYLAAHIYGNATAEDFWNAQTATSHKPVDKIMNSFVSQPGEPLLTFERANNGKVTVSQERFFLDPKDATGEDQVWTVPVCFKSEGKATDCEILQSNQQELPTPAAPFFFGDAAGTGYYRAAYAPADYKKILANIETGLQPTERITFVGGQFALTRSGQASIGDYLNLAEALKSDPTPDVLDTVATGLNTTATRIASTAKERAELHTWVRQVYSPEYAKLGAPSSSDSQQKRELRATLMQILGGADDPKVIAAAREITEKHLADPESVDPTLAAPALYIAAAHGDAALFDQLQKTYENSKDPDMQESALRAMAVFREPALEKRALDYAVSGKVRNQDALFTFVIAMQSEETQDFAWQYIQQNWPQVQSQITTTMGGYLVGSTGSFCSADKKEEVTSFFTTHKVPASEKTLKRAQNSIDSCIDLRAEQGAKLQTWLNSQQLEAASASTKGN